MVSTKQVSLRFSDFINAQQSHGHRDQETDGITKRQYSIDSVGRWSNASSRESVERVETRIEATKAYKSLVDYNKEPSTNEENKAELLAVSGRLNRNNIVDKSEKVNNVSSSVSKILHGHRDLTEPFLGPSSKVMKLKRRLEQA